MKRIVLYRLPQGWMAWQPDNPEIRRLFGSDTIPTAFTARAEPEEVRAAIQRLNADCDVSVACGGQVVTP